MERTTTIPTEDYNALIAALDHAEAVMSIVAPRSDTREYLETLHEIRAALARANPTQAETGRITAYTTTAEAAVWEEAAQLCDDYDTGGFGQHDNMVTRPDADDLP